MVSKRMEGVEEIPEEAFVAVCFKEKGVFYRCFYATGKTFI